MGDIGDRLHAKLVRAGLTEPRAQDVEESTNITLKQFVIDFIADRRTSHGKPAAQNTVAKWETLQGYLTRYFKSRAISQITPRDAQEFRKYLERHRFAKTKSNPEGSPLSENAKRKLLATAKVIFNSAVRLDLVERNPFEFEVSSTTPNRSRDFYVTPEMTATILAACPNTQWKLMFALWRLAGLRKMEIFALQWEHILWDRGRVLVHSSKTAHHDGCGSRYVPIGGVVDYLQAARDEAEPHSNRVVTRYRATSPNLHKPFGKILTSVGLSPWPKLFHNLRSSCETEWLDSGLPAHVVANWMGQNVKVQNDKYAQVDDHHFDNFNSAQSRKVAHQVPQYRRESKRMPAKPKRKPAEKHSVFRGLQSFSGSSDENQLPRRGVEQMRFPQRFSQIPKSVAHYVAHCQRILIVLPSSPSC